MEIFWIYFYVTRVSATVTCTSLISKLFVHVCFYVTRLIKDGMELLLFPLLRDLLREHI
jgi:hypothetical protein